MGPLVDHLKMIFSGVPNHVIHKMIDALSEQAVTEVDHLPELAESDLDAMTGLSITIRNRMKTELIRRKSAPAASGAAAPMAEDPRVAFPTPFESGGVAA